MEEDGDFFKWERGYFYWGGGGLTPPARGLTPPARNVQRKNMDNNVIITHLNDMWLEIHIHILPQGIYSHRV